MQMIYLIENQIVFNPEDNSLSLPDDTESKITVSNPARRILSLLIEQHGTVVQRETFFKKVWDDYGLTASNNNLNHCISKLRKVVSTLGYTGELIITVPKVGFIIKKETEITAQFELNITQEKTEPLAEETNALPEIMPADLPHTEPQAPPAALCEPVEQSEAFTVTEKTHYKYPFIFTTFFLLSFAVWGLHTLQGVLTDPKARLQVSKIGVCDLYSTAPVSKSRKQDFILLAQNFILKNNMTCTPGNIFVFQTEQFTTPINTGSVRDFMAQCSTNDSHKINICISYYANDRTTHDKF
ncbi:winged helix-turn-helix domain-containing protein [Rahnella inusitata]|uniref:winged helix-turn-helix domain-containing protein n=1 Tax=Rahnella inusitata TaxID=58169 RepID=UPI0039AF5F3A